MGNLEFEHRIAAVRRFNRFYTQKIGVLRKGLLDSPFSLAEARVLYELAHRDRPSASDLARDLGLDAGYLSRILARFERAQLLQCERSRTDGRKRELVLTRKGRAAFAKIDQGSQQDVGAWLGRIPEEGQERLVGAMDAIQRILAGARLESPVFLRAHRPGDIGWVINRHGEIYATEYGWDETFEAMVAEIAAKFIRRFDPKREHCWIAERDGERVGSVLLVKKSPTVAQLRLLIVDPKARGLGVGGRLVDACIDFARRARYRKIVLWTNDILHVARRIYLSRGFVLVKEERHHSFGQDLVGQNWELTL